MSRIQFTPVPGRCYALVTHCSIWRTPVPGVATWTVQGRRRWRPRGCEPGEGRRWVTGEANESFVVEDIWALEGEHISGGSVDPHCPLAAASRTAGTFHNFVHPVNICCAPTSCRDTASPLRTTRETQGTRCRISRRTVNLSSAELERETIPLS